MSALSKTETNGILVVALLFLLSSASWAGTPAADSDPCLSDPACVELTDQARNLSQVGQHDAALVSYQTAYGRRPVPWLLYNIARIQHKLGRLEQAVAGYQQFLKLSTSEADQALREKAKGQLDDAQKELAARQRPAPAPVAESPKEVSAKPVPVYKRWWFWVAIAGGTAVIATGLGVGLALRKKEPAIPDGVMVLDVNF